MSKRGFTLIEVLVVIGIVAILLAIAGPPFMAMLKRSTVEENAQRLQEAIKSSQIEAQKRGFRNISTTTGIVFSKQVVYLAIYPDTKMIRVLAWQDINMDTQKTDDEFSVLQELSLGVSASFLRPISIGKVACGTTDRTGTSTDGIVNFTALGNPIGLTLFPTGNTRYVKFNGKGFAESMQNVSVYITGTNGDTFAVTMNPIGLTELCRWDGSRWIKLK